MPLITADLKSLISSIVNPRSSANRTAPSRILFAEPLGALAQMPAIRSFHSFSSLRLAVASESVKRGQFIFFIDVALIHSEDSFQNTGNGAGSVSSGSAVEIHRFVVFDRVKCCAQDHSP